jgi:hypothetical protein
MARSSPKQVPLCHCAGLCACYSCVLVAVLAVVLPARKQAALHLGHGCRRQEHQQSSVGEYPRASARSWVRACGRSGAHIVATPPVGPSGVHLGRQRGTRVHQGQRQGRRRRPVLLAERRQHGARPRGTARSASLVPHGLFVPVSACRKASSKEERDMFIAATAIIATDLWENRKVLPPPLPLPCAGTARSCAVASAGAGREGCQALRCPRQHAARGEDLPRAGAPAAAGAAAPAAGDERRHFPEHLATRRRAAHARDEHGQPEQVCVYTTRGTLTRHAGVCTALA